MKLKYEFEFIDVDDELVAVPIGDNATDFHGMIKINEETKEMLEIIKTCNKPEEVLDILCKNHPEDKKDELGRYLCNFLNDLVRQGILIP